jgi:hypothetical protein
VNWLGEKRKFFRKYVDGKGELLRNIFGENADFLDIFLETFAFLKMDEKEAKNHNHEEIGK